MSNADQRKLEKEVNLLIKKYGTDKAVEIIKNKQPRGIWSSMNNYENGVFVHCNSEKGGVLVGTKSYK